MGTIVENVEEDSNLELFQCFYGQCWHCHVITSWLVEEDEILLLQIKLRIKRWHKVIRYLQILRLLLHLLHILLLSLLRKLLLLLLLKWEISLEVIADGDHTEHLWVELLHIYVEDRLSLESFCKLTKSPLFLIFVQVLLNLILLLSLFGAVCSTAWLKLIVNFGFIDVATGQSLILLLILILSLVVIPSTIFH